MGCQYDRNSYEWLLQQRSKRDDRFNPEENRCMQNLLFCLISVSYVFWVLIPSVLFSRRSGQMKLINGRHAEGRHQLVQPSDNLHSLLDLIPVNLFVSQIKLAENFSVWKMQLCHGEHKHSLWICIQGCWTGFCIDRLTISWCCVHQAQISA